MKLCPVRRQHAPACFTGYLVYTNIAYIRFKRLVNVSPSGRVAYKVNTRKLKRNALFYHKGKK